MQEGAPTLQMNCSLEAIIQRDEETNFYIAHFKGFPEAIAYDETEQKSVLRLIELFKIMLRDEREKVIEKLLKDQEFPLNINMVPA